MVSKKHSTFAAHLEKCLGKTSCGNSSVGRAQPCQGWGREFESRFPLVQRNIFINEFILKIF